MSYEPPPQINEFKWIWQKWIYGLWAYLDTAFSFTGVDATFKGDLQVDGDLTVTGSAPTSAEVSLTVAPADASMFIILSQQPTGNEDLHTDTGIVYDSTQEKLSLSGILEIDDIRENTSANGVEVDGVLCKDGQIPDLGTPTQTPSSASDTGTTGTIAWDSNYIYICTATNTWKRVAIATW